MAGSNADNKLDVDTPIICLMGPTATGKTDAAAHLTHEFDCEIVSVDSSLVYQGMDIGTAKPDKEFLRKYPHYLVDIRHPNDTYSVADFFTDANEKIQQICARGKIPVLVGGTMFYFNALEHGLTKLPAANQTLRDEIITIAQQKGWPALHQQLAEIDADSAQRIDKMDAQRIQRALEIVLESGKSIAEHNMTRQPGIPNPLIKIALCLSDRKKLHNRIEQRFDIMLEQGLQGEVEHLLANGVNAETPSMKMIGYRQMSDFLNNELSYDEMRNKGIVATRQLAKRQLTWLRNQPNMLWWVDTGIEEKKFNQLATFLEHKLSFLTYN